MSIKKAFQPLVDFLQENKDSKVSTLMEDITRICSAKTAGGSASASVKDKEGNVVAIRCSFFEKWFPVSHVEFGKKEGTATGFNPMCKEGANGFSKLQRDYRGAKETVLDKVSSGEIKPQDIQKELETLEKARVNRPKYSVKGMGWDKAEECIAQKKGVLNNLVNAHEDILKAAADKEIAKAAAAEAKEAK